MPHPYLHRPPAVNNDTSLRAPSIDFGGFKMELCDLDGLFGQKRIFPIVEMGRLVQISLNSRRGRRAQSPISCGVPGPPCLLNCLFPCG